MKQYKLKNSNKPLFYLRLLKVLEINETIIIFAFVFFEELDNKEKLAFSAVVKAFKRACKEIIITDRP